MIPAAAPVPLAHAPLNAALLCDPGDTAFLASALACLAPGPALVITEDPGLFARLGGAERRDFVSLGFEEIPIRFDQIGGAIAAALAETGATRVIVDMRWGLRTVSASANFENWGKLCDRLAAERPVAVVSLYDRPLLIEDQLLAALRAHAAFLAPSGLYANPFWLPPDYLDGATLTEQIGYLLGRTVPDYAEDTARPGTARDAASGADPHWIAPARRIQPRASTGEIWKIRCFGRLRIYLSDGSQIRWALPGSSPKKTKLLFAFLLQSGEKGARAAQLAELLWPEEPDEDVKRARLHHAVAMLRKTLGGRGYVQRLGEYYSLLPPAGTWIDIASFEQLCNRAKIVAAEGQYDEAITLLDAADRLYSGDLFEEFEPEEVTGEGDDWIAPRRTWLKEMALKVQRDKAAILRGQGSLRAALECCQKALAMDPACEIVHAEAMRVFAAQGRPEAALRQYRQYRAALEAIGAGDTRSEIDDLHKEISKSV